MPIRSRKRKQKYRRAFIITLSGVSHSWLRLAMERGLMPRTAEIFRRGDFTPVSGLPPAVENVTWNTFATGRNPGGHGIFGAVDRKPENMEVYEPETQHRRAPAMWDVCGEAGLRSAIIGLPGNFPPRPIHGIQVADAPGRHIRQAALPSRFAHILEQLDYVVSVDSSSAALEPEKYISALELSLERRKAVTYYFIGHEPWSVFVVHIPETGHLNRFFFPSVERGEGEFAPRIAAFFAELDGFIATLRSRIPPDTAFMCVSDHGYCALRKEVDLNAFLHSEGFLFFDKRAAGRLADLAADSTAYSLESGRIYVYLRGREANGHVLIGADYDKVIRDLVEALHKLRDPETGNPVVHRVLHRDDVYSGALTGKAPDLICEPFHGYQFISSIGGMDMFSRAAVSGMRTPDDAFLFIEDHEIAQDMPQHVDIAPTVLHMLGVATPPMEGRTLVTI